MRTPTNDGGSSSLDRRLLLSAAGLAGIAALASTRAKAGPLNPPAGAIGSTGKTLAEVEPRVAVNSVNTPPSGAALFTITQPGSYYLTGNITVPASSVGVGMTAQGVTLDLNGFTITGTGSNSVGVVLTLSCTVRNGHLRSLTFGAAAQGTSNTNLEDLTVIGCTTRGIAAGDRAAIRRCFVSGPAPVGIELGGDHGFIEDCSVTGATVQGAYINSYTTVRGCRFHNCGVGLRMGYGSRAERCAFDNCTGTGLQSGTRAHVESCSATSCGTGIELGDGSTMTDTACTANATGASAAAAARIADCWFDSNTSIAVRITASGTCVESSHFARNGTGVDMTNVVGNYVHKCVFLGNTSFVAVNIGGNWYPSVALGGVNTATNPLASVVG